MKAEVSLFLLMSIIMPIRPIWAQPNCGGGEVGDGICADSSLCCSQWGHCGSGASYCTGASEDMSPPVPVAPNNNDGNSPCSSLRRCGYAWEDANSKCGAPCTLWEDPACAVGENCYGNLVTDLECCQDLDLPLDLTPPPSTTYLRTSTPTAGTIPPVAPPVEPPVASPVPVPPVGGSCSVSRCGATWNDANTKCDPACSSWNDPICSSGENCYDSLSTSLACCDDAPNDNVPSNDDPVVGTCGNGSVGNDICSDPSLCCSQWGWCDNSAGHCGDNPTPFPTLQPPSPVQTPPPTQAAPTPTANGSPPNSMDAEAEHSRLIAYVGNWQACPTRDQWEHYTHIVIAFAVSYTWSPGRNQCSAACDIATPPVCNNAPNPELIQEWKDAGKKVLLSFGGAGMGGSWTDDVNDCWEDCFSKEDHVVDQLVSIVNNMNLDGIDLDYEYFYEDNQNNSGFSKGAEAQHFLSSVTTGLRQKLPSDSIVTHAPMDVDLLPETDYYHILKNQADELDFLMPQYYNGVTRPGSNFAGALNHYTVMVDEIFQGDPTKIVFGFCIADCGGTFSNLNGAQSALVMTQLQSTYPCNGGAFFWVAQHDVGGAWSASVSTAIGQNVCQG